MGYLIKSDVISTVHEDRETSLMCYEDKATKEIIRFCYDSIEREINRLSQYRVGNVAEIKKEELITFAVAVLAEVTECAKQEDAPLYEGDKEVDCFVRLSDVNDAINKHLNELVN